MKTINIIEDLPSFQENYPDWRITSDTIIRGVSSPNDKMASERILYSKVGDTLINNLTGYLFQAQKVLKCYTLPVYTCKYIALDFNELDVDNKDSLISSIAERARNGEKFETLAKAYSMDGNTNYGADFVFHKTLFPELTESVISHDVGDIFAVDIPDINWTFVVFKNKPDSISTAVTIVSIDL